MEAMFAEMPHARARKRNYSGGGERGRVMTLKAGGKPLTA